VTFTNNLLKRVVGKYRRLSAEWLCRRKSTIRSSIPIVSFTFDDAPRTAFTVGGGILRSAGARGTFFVSFGLLGLTTEVGIIAFPDDLIRAVAEGNELGCHTFDHLDTWETSSDKYVKSVIANRQALDKMLPGVSFKSFAYPKSLPRPVVKRRLEKYFVCCRGGGQTINTGTVDLNLLNTCFLDRRTGIDMNFVERLIDYNTLRKGWLIFATHDVTDDPSRYGCAPRFFSSVVDYADRSGALILPISEAYDRLWPSDSANISAE
jgi:peptidoglycan/xylan/chitin deacetylase (PgdA/CDA1 family)